MKESLSLLASFLKLALRTELQAQGHLASGKLAQSIETAVTQTMSGFEIVGSAIYYAKYVEGGRKPGARGVPLDALIEWVRQKKMTLGGKNERSVAFMIQRSIKVKGIAPSLFIAKTLRENTTAIEHRVEEAMSSMVDTYIEQMFNELKTQ